MKIKYVLLFLILFVHFNSIGQAKKTDSISKKTSFSKFKSYAIPTAMTAYGFIALGSNSLKSLDRDIKNNFKNSKKTSIDDFGMVLPSLSVYGLNFLGKKGKHNFKDRSIIFGTASVIVLSSVISLKAITARQRPNLESNDAFPSGHTAISFMGAEFLHQEYKHISPWYGIAGYTIATATGYLRIHNNKHWFSDVVAGAGIGILSTKIAYLINPYIQKKIFKKKKHLSHTFVNPFYNGEQTGISFSASF